MPVPVPVHEARHVICVWFLILLVAVVHSSLLFFISGSREWDGIRSGCVGVGV